MKPPIKNRNLLRTQAYIDGNWVGGGKGKTFSILNPFDETEIVKVPDLGKAEAIQAVEAANWAFPEWSAMLPAERGRKLKRLAELIKQNEKDLAILLTLEQGKPLQEAQEEVFDTIEITFWFAEEATRVHGFTQCDPDDKRSVMTIRQPMGLVGVITPWNFPLMIAAQKCFAALAAGCTVILKPAEDTPLTSLALAYLSQEAQIPPGVFNVVTCKQPQEVAEVLTTHPFVSKMTFTGSTEVGKKILAMCAPTVKKVTLELGGNCPVIVFEDADIEKALEGIFNLKFYNCGQCCNTINRILVHHTISDKFIKKFISMTENLSVGSGLKEVNLGPLINRDAKKKVDDLVKDAFSHGAEVITAKKKPKGLLCPPIVIKNANTDMRIYSEEIFGPVAPFYTFDTEDEAIAIANDTRYGLAAYLYTENVSRALRVSKSLEAGSVGINTTSVFSITLPFGGWKESGIGRENGLDSLNDYCEIKSISIAN